MGHSQPHEEDRGKSSLRSAFQTECLPSSGDLPTLMSVTPTRLSDQERSHQLCPRPRHHWAAFQSPKQQEADAASPHRRCPRRGPQMLLFKGHGCAHLQQSHAKHIENPCGRHGKGGLLGGTEGAHPYPFHRELE